MRERPMSPHLGVYRWAYTMTMSILNRATGIALSVALIVLAAWLMAAASGPEAYDRTATVLGHGFFKLLYAAWLLAFVYHLLNGLRHLMWDTGKGMERHEARTSGYIVIVATIVSFLVLAWFAFFAGGGAR